MLPHDGEGLAASMGLTGDIVPNVGKLEREHQMMPNKNPKVPPLSDSLFQQVPTS